MLKTMNFLKNFIGFTVVLIVFIIMVTAILLSSFDIPNDVVAKDTDIIDENEEEVEQFDEEDIDVAKENAVENIQIEEVAEKNQPITNIEDPEELCRCCHGRYADIWYPHRMECRAEPGTDCVFDLYCFNNCGNTEMISSPSFQMYGCYEVIPSCTYKCTVAVCIKCATLIYAGFDS